MTQPQTSDGMLSEEQLESAWIALRIISNAPSGKQAKASIKGHIAAQAKQLKKAEDENKRWTEIMAEELGASLEMHEVLGVDQSRVEDGVTLRREELRCAKALVAERDAQAEGHRVLLTWLTGAKAEARLPTDPALFDFPIAVARNALDQKGTDDA